MPVSCTGTSRMEERKKKKRKKLEMLRWSIVVAIFSEEFFVNEKRTSGGVYEHSESGQNMAQMSTIA